MRVHVSSIATAFVALLFVSGTVGCRSTGGPWYNPKSYTFTNPFADSKNPFAGSKNSPSKNNTAPPFSTGAQANSKPSADSQPNISVPPGGYTDRSLAGRAGSSGAEVGLSAPRDGITASNSPPDHWGQQSPVAQHSSTNTYSGYSVAEPSQFYQYADSGQQGNAPSSYVASAPQQYPSASSQNPYAYPAEASQAQYAGQPVSYAYGSDPLQSNYQATSAYTPQQPTGIAMAGTYPGQTSNPYTAYAIPKNDPYAAVQQPPAGLTQGYGYEQPIQPSYSGDGMLPGTAYQPYQPSAQPYQPPAAGSGYNYSY